MGGLALVLRSADAGELVRRLDPRGMIASARGPGLRVSFHAYNADDHVDAVLDALKAESRLLSAGAAPRIVAPFGVRGSEHV